MAEERRIAVAESAKRYAKYLLAFPFILPVIVALLSLTSGDTASAGGWLNLWGRLTGIAGLCCLLLASLLAIRIPGFDRLFGGLTRLWRLHHRLGGVAFVLILAHPLLLALAGVEVSLTAAMEILFPREFAPGLWLGWGALLLTMLFLAPSFAFFGEPEYQRWKQLHRVSGVALLLALVHTLLLARGPAFGWQWLLWCVLAAVAVSAVGYRILFSRYMGARAYRVSAIARPANNVVELSLLAEGKPLSYQPGQFIYLTPRDRQLTAGYGEEHPYTLSSAPAEPQLRVAIKDLGDASRAIQQIALGSRVMVEGPYGDFFADCGGQELWIAGGIGITPFLARLRHLCATAQTVDISLIYCVQDENRALFFEEITELASAIPGFQLTMHYFYRDGPLSAEFLRSHCTGLGSGRAYLCGPETLLSLARMHLLAEGLPRRHLYSEEFSLL